MRGRSLEAALYRSGPLSIRAPLMFAAIPFPDIGPDLFRIGASSMLADIERQLEHFMTGRYSALSHHPVA